MSDISIRLVSADIMSPWHKLVGVELKMSHGEPCYRVENEAGKVDYWAMNITSAKYEFGEWSRDDV